MHKTIDEVCSREPSSLAERLGLDMPALCSREPIIVSTSPPWHKPMSYVKPDTEFHSEFQAIWTEPTDG